MLKSAEHNSVQPDLAPQAARSAKRSRQATPEDCAGELPSCCVSSHDQVPDAMCIQPLP